MTDRQRIAQLSPEELQQLANKLLRGERSSPSDTIGDANRALTQAEADPNSIPLTPAQKSYFDFDPVEPNKFVVTVLRDCARRLSASLIRPALRHVLAHHDALRLQFQRREHAWHQQYSSPDHELTSFETVDLAGVSKTEQESSMARTARRVSEGLHITRGPLLSVVLFELGPNRPQYLLLVIHHLLVDLPSLQIILEDLQAAHDQLAAGCAVRLPAKTAPFAVYAEKLQAYTRSPAAQEEGAYWRSLPWSSVSHLPVDYPLGENTAPSIGIVRASLSVEETAVLTEEAPVVYRARINKLLLLALLKALTRWSGRCTVAIDLLEHGRNGSFLGLDLSRTVGWFSSEYPLVLAVDEKMRDSDILQSLGEQMRGVPNDGVTYGALRYCREGTPLIANPVPEIRFNYQGTSDHHLLSGETEEPDDLADMVTAHYGHAMRRHLLNVTSVVIGKRLRVCFEYSTALHAKRTIDALATGFIDCLRESISYAGAARAEGRRQHD